MDHAERILIETQIYGKTFFIVIYGFQSESIMTLRSLTVISSQKWPNLFSEKTQFVLKIVSFSMKKLPFFKVLSRISYMSKIA